MLLVDDPGTTWRRFKANMIIKKLRFNRCFILLVLHMNRIGDVGETEVRESGRPISLVADLGDTLHMRHKYVTVRVEEADRVDGMREDNLAHESLLHRPELDGTARVASYD